MGKKQAGFLDALIGSDVSHCVKVLFDDKPPVSNPSARPIRKPVPSKKPKKGFFQLFLGAIEAFGELSDEWYEADKKKEKEAKKRREEWQRVMQKK